MIRFWASPLRSEILGCDRWFDDAVTVGCRLKFAVFCWPFEYFELTVDLLSSAFWRFDPYRCGFVAVRACWRSKWRLSMVGTASSRASAEVVAWLDLWRYDTHFVEGPVSNQYWSLPQFRSVDMSLNSVLHLLFSSAKYSWYTANWRSSSCYWDCWRRSGWPTLVCLLRRSVSQRFDWHRSLL